MTIERLHFEKGMPLPSGGSLDEIERIILENQDQIISLPEGEYDLTPQGWKKHPHLHQLTVLKDGTGVYRAIPREKNAGTISLSREGRGRFQMGVQTIRIPEDQSVAILAGPLEDRKTLGLYEIILYSSGENSQKKT